MAEADDPDVKLVSHEEVVESWRAERAAWAERLQEKGE
jgi:hypothetical protein